MFDVEQFAREVAQDLLKHDRHEEMVQRIVWHVANARLKPMCWVQPVDDLLGMTRCTYQADHGGLHSWEQAEQKAAGMTEGELDRAIAAEMGKQRIQVREHLHTYQVALGDGFALRYCALCEKSWMLLFVDATKVYETLARGKLKWIEIPEG